MSVIDFKKPTINSQPIQIIVRTNKGRMLITPVYSQSKDVTKPIKDQGNAGVPTR